MSAITKALDKLSKNVPKKLLGLGNMNAILHNRTFLYIVFAFSFGSYEVPYLLGEPFPSTVSVVAYQLYSDRDLANRPTAMALATITSVVIGLLVYAYMRLTQQEGRK